MSPLLLLLRINDDNVKDKGGDKVIKKMGGRIKRNVNQTKKNLLTFSSTLLKTTSCSILCLEQKSRFLEI